MIRSIRLCGSACALPLTHDVHHGLNGMCVKSCFYFLRLGRLARCGGLAPLLPRQEFGHRQLDYQQLVAQLRHRAWVKLEDFANYLNLQLVHDFCEFCNP